MKYTKSNKNFFFIGLKGRVDHYFKAKGISRFGNANIAIKGTLLVAVYLCAYTSLFFSNTNAVWLTVAYVILGWSGVMIVFNLVHDASHQALSSKKWLNNTVRYFGDLVGINTYIWDIRHNIQHHAYTNILGGDLIIENIPLLRLSPHQPYRKFHQYQQYYAPVLYMFYTLYWMMVIDFKLFMAKDICNHHNLRHPRREWVILIASKLFYITYTIIFPWLFTSVSLAEALGYFFIMHFAAGLLLSAVAVLGHFVEGPAFPEAHDGLIDNSWSEHELDATIDFAPHSRIINWITGGLNTHVAHHLFPNVCHVHYYELTPVIEAYCREFNFEYKKESLAGALRSHFRYLARLGQNEGHDLDAEYRFAITGG